MDEKDELIIRILERSAKLSSRAIAKEVGLPISTVHRRIRRLEQEGVITGYKALINYEKTKRPIGAYVFINLEEVTTGKSYISKAEIIDELKKIDGVQELIDVQGFNVDLVLKVRFANLKKMSAFAELLRAMEGVENFVYGIIIEKIR
jgi:DNA-binding Lrp family transcriptional regulator